MGAGVSGRHLRAGEKRGEKVGLTRRGRGSKVMLVVEGQGLPLGVLVEMAESLLSLSPAGLLAHPPASPFGMSSSVAL